MKIVERVILGGLGALTPIIASIACTDPAVLWAGATKWVVAGHLFRGVLFFGAGAIIVYLYEEEKNKLKLFQLGLAAPALLMSMINARNIESYLPRDVTPPLVSMQLVSNAYAQQPREEIGTFALPSKTAAEEFYRGLTGAALKEVWFVIAGSYGTLPEAQRHAQQINERQIPELTAQVYAPYKKESNYSVVVGSNLSYEQARRLQKKAIESGLEGAQLWTFGEAQ